MKSKVVIPAALQICMDDIGWHIGHDQRHIGRPSRTGIPRHHSPLDYIAVNEVGKAVGMKIMCPLCIGEWDKDNILTHEVGTTYEPHTWDRASKINYKVAEQCFEAAESSEYIEYALHGILHGNYDENGGQITELEYFEHHSPDDPQLYCMNENEILRRIDIFERIYDSWGFKKKIRSYAAPNGIPTNLTFDDLSPMVSAFNKKEIFYWTNYWLGKEMTGKFLDGVLYTTKSTDLIIPWNAYDYDPTYLADFAKEGDTKVFSVLGMHWPNFLKFNPENNEKATSLWIDYLKKQSEIFGLMISKDIAFSGNQYIYKELSTIAFGEKQVNIDVSPVFEQKSLIPDGEFYISLKNDVKPIKSDGCTFEMHEKHNDFVTYKITHNQKQMTIFVE